LHNRPKQDIASKPHNNSVHLPTYAVRGRQKVNKITFMFLTLQAPPKQGMSKKPSVLVCNCLKMLSELV